MSDLFEPGRRPLLERVNTTKNKPLGAFSPGTVLKQGTTTRMQPARPEVISIYYKVATQILYSSHALHELSQPNPRLQSIAI